MYTFISEYWDEILLTIITAAVLALIRWIHKTTKEQKAMQQARARASLVLLRRNLYADINWCRDKGFCPIWMRENIDAEFTEYKNLGGNGMMEKMINSTYELPSKEESNEGE